MRWILHLGFALLGIILFNTRVANCITCLKCKDVQDLRSCDQAIVCEANQTCYIEKKLSPVTFEPVYSAGCRHMDYCKLELCNKQAYGDGNSRKRQANNDLTLCSKCCFEDICNAEGCGYKPPQNNITRCFNCEEVYEGGPLCLKTVDCDLKLYACSVTNHPRSHHSGAYELGCKFKKTQCNVYVNLTSDHKDDNVRCCDTNMCNVSPYSKKINKIEMAHSFKCPEGIKRPTTKPPLPPKTTKIPTLKPTKPANSTMKNTSTIAPPTKPPKPVSTVSPTFDSHTPSTVPTITSSVPTTQTTTLPTTTSTVPTTKTTTLPTTTSTVPTTKTTSLPTTTSTVPTTKTSTLPTTTSTTQTTQTTTLLTTTSTLPTTKMTTTLPTTKATTTIATTVAPSTGIPRKTLPPVTTMCAVCSGPEFLCEQLYASTPCTPPNNYCINSVTNHLDGTKTVVRSCGNIDTCYKDWFEGSSDDDKCRNFDENDQQYLDFQCTFCCTTDDCNIPLHPSKQSLYTPV